MINFERFNADYMNIYNIALSLTPRIGSRTALQLIERFFSAENIFSQSLESLTRDGGLREDVALSIVNRVAFADAERQMKHCERYGIDVVCYVDEFYPPLLREVSDPPFVLYVQGNKEILTRNIISIIGTRRCSSYGDRVTVQIVKELSERVHNLVIGSGLALGIDSVAHRAAMNFHTPTIAFLPTSLPDIIPAAHGNLAREILESGGALVSEIASTTKISHSKPGYMQRNRIVVGSAGATIVAECGFGGGAYKAAMNAIDEGLIVGAVPGRLGDSGSFGCNLLISSSTAFMVLGAESILRELKWDDRRKEDSENIVAKGRSAELERWGSLTSDQVKLLTCFADEESMHISALQKMSELPIGLLSAMLMELSVLGAVNPLPGSLYERIIALSDIEKDK